MTEERSIWPPTFSLDGPSIMGLLTGDRFYSSADAALREAILNSIDACGRRSAEGNSYHPTITVTFDEATRTFTIAGVSWVGPGQLIDLAAEDCINSAI